MNSSIKRVFDYIYNNVEDIDSDVDYYYFRLYNDFNHHQNFGFYISKVKGLDNNGNTTPCDTEENMRNYLKIINELFDNKLEILESIN